jgi:hypothetical protein
MHAFSPFEVSQGALGYLTPAEYLNSLGINV